MAKFKPPTLNLASSIAEGFDVKVRSVQAAPVSVLLHDNLLTLSPTWRHFLRAHLPRAMCPYPLEAR